MTYDLFIGDRSFSSWSLRGWLMLEKFGISHRTHMVGLYSGKLEADLKNLAPARLVPVLQLPDGTIVGETVAMAETLHERHPEAGYYPKSASARATARWLIAEMACGFQALRSECSMQLIDVKVGFPASETVRADLERLEKLWAHAWQFANDGPWLFGAYSLADVFYAPVCARIIGYDLPVSEKMRAYCQITIQDPAFRHWRNRGLEVTYDPVPYSEKSSKTRPWPA